MKQLPTTRTCGPCRGCCKPFSVPEVGKYDATWCPKSTPCNGCTIYSTRPEACRSFACIWLNGLGEESDRPDILGVMLDVQGLDLLGREVPLLHIWELEVNALGKPRVIQILETNVRLGCVVKTHQIFDDQSFYMENYFDEDQFSPSEVAYLMTDGFDLTHDH